MAPYPILPARHPGFWFHVCVRLIDGLSSLFLRLPRPRLPILARGFRYGRGPALPLQRATGVKRDRALARAPHPEWGLVHQGADLLLARDKASGWLVRRAGRAFVTIGAPFGQADLAAIAATAWAERAVPLLYKCDARSAARARRAGWSVIRLATEAVVAPIGWTPDRPACRQLRRKLRQAQAASVTVAVVSGSPPIPAMAKVSADWGRCHGAERGFSMGQFDPYLLQRQRVFLAWQGGRLIGFASFHVLSHDWSLDLMRQTEDAPEGTMHLIMTTAIEAAKSHGCRRLSFAAFPSPAGPLGALLRRVGVPADCGQFKRAFGPALVPLYAASPGPVRLCATLAAVARAIHAPGPDGRGLQGGGGDHHPLHRKHENFRFESGTPPCDAQDDPAPRRDLSRARLLTGCPDDKCPIPPA